MRRSTSTTEITADCLPVPCPRTPGACCRRPSSTSDPVTTTTSFWASSCSTGCEGQIRPGPARTATSRAAPDRTRQAPAGGALLAGEPHCSPRDLNGVRTRGHEVKRAPGREGARTPGQTGRGRSARGRSRRRLCGSIRSPCMCPTEPTRGSTVLNREVQASFEATFMRQTSPSSCG